ncbi:DUF1956 domain-containing protein [Xylophilus sp. Kf1]|nr:DUF1956 domain-containing protein [Xylophilus sp. Kf1]
MPPDHSSPTPPNHLPSAAPADSGATRERLLDNALRLFSERGFARTSTRALAEAAGANLAAIRYYFGDKAGLYRATFHELCNNCGASVDFDRHPSLESLLPAYYDSFVEPLKQGERMQQAMRLYIREMLEPTEQWQTERERDARQHAGLVAALGRALGVRQADDDLHRLAIAIAGLGIQLMVARDLAASERPGLLASPEALDAWCERLVAFALALVDAERVRRAALPPSAPAFTPDPTPPVTPPTPARRQP